MSGYLTIRDLCRANARRWDDQTFAAIGAAWARQAGLRQGPARTCGLHDLTATERRLFDALHQAQPHWLKVTYLIDVALASSVYSDERQTLRVHLTRLRGKLAGSGWRIERARFGESAYRLVRDDQSQERAA